MQLPALAVQSGDVTNGLLKAQQLAASQQGIENSQIRNKLLMQQQQDQQAARAQQRQINALASGAVGGDESAMKRLWGADPKLAQTIAGHVSKMDDRQREQAARQANVVGRAAMALHRLKQSGASDQEMAAQYAVYRKGMADSGFDVSGIPEAYTPDLGPRLKAMALESEAVGEMLNQTTYETVTDSGGNIVGQRNMKTGKVESDPRAPKETAPTELTRLIAERDQLPEGDPNRAAYDQAIAKKVASTGMRLETNADGTFTLTQGGQQPLGQKATNDVEQGLLDAGAAMQRVMNIERSFNPEFLTLGRQFENWTSAIQDKTIGGLSPEAKRKMGEYTRFTTATLSNVNRTIKELTGAAMSQGEAKRIMGELPNEKDSPTEFKAKMDLVTENLRNVMARLNYIRNNGLSIEDVRIDEMRGIIAKRGNELIRELRQPGVSDTDLEDMVMGRLADEFGLVGG